MTIDKNKNILIMLANTGQCYAKLSYKSHKEYDQIQSGLSLPVIFLSTIIGTASFTGLSIKYYFYMSMVIGFVNILISILTTILRYFKISEYSEMYRVAHIAWDSYVREILLVLPNIKDDEFDEFFNKKLNQFNALVDTTPIFPKRTLKKFEKYVKHINNQYIKPAQINKQILSIKTYIDKFDKINEIEIDIENNIDITENDKCCLCFEKCCSCFCKKIDDCYCEPININKCFSCLLSNNNEKEKEIHLTIEDEKKPGIEEKTTTEEEKITIEEDKKKDFKLNKPKEPIPRSKLNTIGNKNIL